MTDNAQDQRRLRRPLHPLVRWPIVSAILRFALAFAYEWGRCHMGLSRSLLAIIHGGGDEAVAAVERMGADWRAMLAEATASRADLAARLRASANQPRAADRRALLLEAAEALESL